MGTQSDPKAFDSVCDHQGFTNLSVMRIGFADGLHLRVLGCGTGQIRWQAVHVDVFGVLGIGVDLGDAGTRKPVLSAPRSGNPRECDGVPSRFPVAVANGLARCSSKPKTPPGLSTSNTDLKTAASVSGCP